MSPDAERLRAALEAVLDREPRGEVHVAVSGGVDSWLLASLLARNGRPVRAWSLASGVEGYCERDQTARLSASLGIGCEFLAVTRADFVNALPEFLAITRTPVYNLHPVSKLLLARELERRGVRRVVTGDGADQVMQGEADCDLRPLTEACFRAAGVANVAPFWSSEVLQAVTPPYPDKQPVRELAASLGLPAIPKRPTLFPPLEDAHQCAASAE